MERRRWAWLGVFCIGMVCLLPKLEAKPKTAQQFSTVIRGALDIDAEGRPGTVEIDGRDRLDPEVAAYVERQVASWVFEPVLAQGRAVPIHSLMTLRLVLEREDKAFTIHVASVAFSDPDPDPATYLVVEQMGPPRYPPAAFRQGVVGDVFVAVQVDQAGAVREVVVEQVNFPFRADAASVRKWTGLFAEATIAAAKQWKFVPPATTPDPTGRVTVRVPINFWLGELGERKYGRWEPYQPGESTPIPWPHAPDPPAFSPDVLMNTGSDLETAGRRPAGTNLSFVPPRARLRVAQEAPASEVQADEAVPVSEERPR